MTRRYQETGTDQSGHPGGDDMRLLILGMNYTPEMTGIGPYTAGLAEHFAQEGHEVAVGTTFPHYPQWEWQSPMARWRRNDRINEVVVRRCRIVLPRRPKLGWRVLYDSSFAGASLLTGGAVRRPDLILCVSPPIQVAFTGALLARRWGVPMVLLLKDLPLDAALSVGMLRRGRGYQLAEWLERHAYALADQIVVINSRFRRSVEEQGVPPHKIAVIPDWADVEHIRPRSPDLDMRALLGASNGEFVVLHSGNMGEKQGLATTVRAAELASRAFSMTLALVGDGPQKRSLEQLVIERGIDSVRILPLQPAAVFPRMLAAADALLLHQRADVVDSVVPSKLLAYMAAGRPILAAANPESVAAHLVGEAGCGVVLPPEDPEVLAAAMRSLSSDPNRRLSLGQAGRRFVEEHYDKTTILNRWESLISDLVTWKARDKTGLGDVIRRGSVDGWSTNPGTGRQQGR